MSRWNTHIRKKKPTLEEQRQQARAAQLEKCKQGQHAHTPTFRPGEQTCTACGIVVYCPLCLQHHHLAPSTSQQAYPLVCSEHRKVTVQA